MSLFCDWLSLSFTFSFIVLCIKVGCGVAEARTPLMSYVAVKPSRAAITPWGLSV